MPSVEELKGFIKEYYKNNIVGNAMHFNSNIYSFDNFSYTAYTDDYYHCFMLNDVKSYQLDITINKQLFKNYLRKYKLKRLI